MLLFVFWLFRYLIYNLDHIENMQHVQHNFLSSLTATHTLLQRKDMPQWPTILSRQVLRLLSWSCSVQIHILKTRPCIQTSTAKRKYDFTGNCCLCCFTVYSFASPGTFFVSPGQFIVSEGVFLILSGTSFVSPGQFVSHDAFFVSESIFLVLSGVFFVSPGQFIVSQGALFV